MSQFSDVRLRPSYPKRSPLEDVLRLVPPGLDDYPSEAWAFEIQAQLDAWSAALCGTVRQSQATADLADPTIRFTAFSQATKTIIRGGPGGLETARRKFPVAPLHGVDKFAAEFEEALKHFQRLRVAEFLITAIEAVSQEPLTVRLAIRYDLTGEIAVGQREQRTGYWQTTWAHRGGSRWAATHWEADEETVARATAGFIDVTQSALGGNRSYGAQLQHGADYWRTVLDGACGIDVYGNNGIAAGDFDGDGFDDLYICQPAGLPNRLYRNRGDGTFEDVTEKAGVSVLDNSACALFADFRNRGLQDLLVVCGGGPLLFENRGNGTFAQRPEAFRFANAPAGTFTHAAVADYDRDGRLDIYLCVYSYYLGLDQYHYPAPYYDARNGPPNFLMRNNGDGTFTDVTEKAGLNAENDRYSFACAWGEIGANGPDLYVANDFGKANLYRNNGDGTFAAVSHAAHTDDAGAGMSACWADTMLSGRQDIYAANMWSAAGQRVSMQPAFHAKAPAAVLADYRQHARGNDLYRNQGDGRFTNVASLTGAAMGRWSWCSDFFDFDQDGYPDLYIANGYISAPDRNNNNLSSFFWRQVVGRSPDDATPVPAYEHGWQAINELIRSDNSWAGYQRNVALANNRDGTFTEISGVAGLDFPEDSRSFAVADLDHDGRLEIILKNRSTPQVRILRNTMQELGRSIAFRLRGTRSNRDAIGTTVTVECGPLRQTRTVRCGSGFLAQHSKTLHFGLGTNAMPVHATVHWPSGLIQLLGEVPAGHMIDVEEGIAQFKATAFTLPPAIWTHGGAAQPQDALPTQTTTWLIEPLAAPAFSLPDLHGTVHTLHDLRGGPVLLCFWAAVAPALDQLRLLARHSPSMAGRVTIIAINIDEDARQNEARAFAARTALSFPTLFATAEVAGIYNIIYRYLFDRRRDLGIPTSFLLDRDGQVVKIYQGEADPNAVREDAAAIPATAAERVARALPFPGTLYQSAFRRNDFTYGVAIFQHGYLDEAASQFRQVIAARPDYPEAYYNLGTLHLQRQDYDLARQNLEQALKLQPNYPEAWNNLGMIAAQHGQTDAAVRDFRQSLSLRPDYATALLNLGNLYRRMGNTDDAQKCLMRAITLEPDDAEANYSVGMFYARQSQPAQAEQYLKNALTLRPGYAEAANNLGVLYVHEQQLAEAESTFRVCIRANPEFDQAYLNLARLYLMQQDKARAASVLNELLRVQPQNAAARQMLDAVNAGQ